MAELTEIKTYDISQAQCGQDGRLKPESLLDLFQQTTISCSAEKGVGNDFMVGIRRGWALVKYDINAARWPQAGETVTVRTAPVGRRWMLVFRQFELMDAGGEIIAAADSCWMVLDLDARKPTDMPKHLAQVYGFDAIANKVLRFDTIGPLRQAQHEKKYEVAPKDIDGYGHVNNTVYIAWAMGALPDMEKDGRAIRRLKCTFKREALLGMTVSARASSYGELTHCEIKGEDGETLFSMVLEWTEE